MTISLKHAFTSPKADGIDPTNVNPSNWNAEHTILMATAKVLGRQSSGTGAVEELPVTGTGNVVLSAAPSFTGNPVFTGNPSFIGNPTFTGNPAITGNFSVTGTCTLGTASNVFVSNNLSVGGASLGGNTFATAGNASVLGDLGVGVNFTAGTITSGNYVRANGFGITMEMNYSGINSIGGAGSNIDCIAQGSGGVRLSAGATAWAVLSDETLKTPFVPFTDALEKVAKIRAGVGRYFTDAEGVSRSFLSAQSVQAVLPEAINVRTSFGEVADPLDGKLMLSYTDVIPLLVAALAEANARIIALEARGI